MSDDAFTTITFRLPSEMREKLKLRATDEERSEGGFIRFHLANILATSEACEDEDAEQPTT